MVSVYHLIVILARSFVRYPNYGRMTAPQSLCHALSSDLRSRGHTVATLVDVRDQLQSESELGTLQTAGLHGKRLPAFSWSS